MTTDSPHPPPAPAGPGVLAYHPPGAKPLGRRLALAAFLWSLFSPATVAAVMYLIVEGPLLDIDDLLPRPGALAVIGTLGIGIPVAGALAGFVAAARATSRRQRWLAVAAAVIGALWSAAAVVLFNLVVRA